MPRRDHARLLILALAAALWPSPGSAPARAAAPVPVIEGVAVVDLEDRIRALTAPLLAGRGAGTEEERLAGALVADWFDEAGLEPAFGQDWIQAVPLPGGGASLNVGGLLPGGGGLAGRWILVGAHLDHLGRVDPQATGVPEPGAFYPGAGDNAAGVAALVATARLAAGEIDGDRRGLLVVAFGAEEIGLLGSAHLAGDPPVPADRLDAVVNLDAVGNLGGGPLHVGGMESSPEFETIVARASGGRIPLSPQPADLLSSDHASFLARGIPSLFLFTSPYVAMNSPADSLTAVDLPGLATVVRTVARLVDGLRRAPGPFPFRAGTTPPAAAVEVGGDRRSWFGTAPDFAASTDAGYRIGGVTPDGPAERAGLQPGDLLVELAGLPVTDLASFTAALRSRPPGAVVEAIVERGGRRLSFPVTLGDRAHRLR